MLRKILLAGSLLLAWGLSSASVDKPPQNPSAETQKCAECHKDEDPAIYEQWGESKHFGANVGCYECHAAKKGEKDAFKHHGKTISIIVSPKDCSNCHATEVKEQEGSHHAAAANIIGSLDNLLAEVVEGNRAMITPGFPGGNSAIAVNGCWQCHGSAVKVIGKKGQLDPATWPNTGVGRINPDGSKGACTACHSRHNFSVAQVRHPDTCGRCHLGPDHPHKEVYEESQHGIAFFANEDKMNLGNAKWIPGEDYNTGPTCATCHMSATADLPVTHDVGARISWNNRPPKSIRPEIADKNMGLPGQNMSWEKRREDMQNVCAACHEDNFVESFYIQYDGVVNLYNEKFGGPGGELYKLAKPLLRPAKFSNKLDWIWFKIWHHEGRRMRMGAAMQAPDYTHWLGAFMVSEHFYIDMMDELERLIDKGMASKNKSKIKAAKALRAKVDEVLAGKNHKWFNNKMDPKEKAARKKAAADYKAIYLKK